MPFLTAILTAISPGYGHAGYQLVQADGVPNLAAAPNLLTNWQLVPIGEGVHTITLVDSDYGSSPDATNKLIFVYTDALQPDSYDYWFFSLNGQGDSQTVNFRTGGRAWFGFLGYGPASAVHGGTTIRIDSGPAVYVEGQQHMATITNLLTNWVHVTDLGREGLFRLSSSDFGSSPDATNEMVFVYNDQMDPSSYDHHIMTLNGVGDEVHVNYLPQGGNCWLGFVAWGPQGLHGGSVVEMDAIRVDGIRNLAAAPNLQANWQLVPIGEGVHTITLVDSDYGSSPDATNKLIFVYTDALQPDSHDYWLFSLNGQGDSQTVNFRTGGRAWFGFLGYGPASAVHGGTTIRIDSGPTVYVEGQQHMATIANLLTNWVHVTDLSPGNAFRLFSSDFGSSPDAANEMVFIYNDQLAPSSYDHFITTLNGVGDEVEINYLPQGGNCWLGFVAWGPESLHGGSVIEIDPPHSAGIDVTAASQSPAANYRVGYATPNPVLESTQFEVDGPAGTGLDWAVYDVSGRCVDSGPLALVGGPQAWNWSRRAGHQRVPGGIYWITFGKGARAVTRQMVLLP